MLKISLFGDPQIRLDGQPVRVSRRRSRALLYYLAAQPQPVSRERLLAFFWPDAPRPAAQQILRTTLYGLRKALGSALLVADTSVALAKEVEVDTRSFEAGLSPLPNDQQALEVTLDLYRGDFLADFYLPDIPAFEDWAVIERERLRRLAVRGFSSLSRLHETQGDLASALACLDRALAFDLLQEDLQRESIRLLYLSGDRPGAIRRYDDLRKLLDEEMGVPPMLETRRLYDAIVKDEYVQNRAGEGPGEQRVRPTNFPFQTSSLPTAQTAGGLEASSLSAPSLPFVGRQDELRMLHDLIAGQKLVMIEGEAGIGKTRLAEEFIRSIQAWPLAGAAYESEGMIPYQPVIEALRSLLARPEWPALRAKMALAPVWWAEMARLLPELSSESGVAGWAAPTRQDAPVRPELPTAGEARLWEGIHRFLTAVSRQRRLVFFLDDLQWADTSTLSLLGYLVRQAETTIFFLAAARPVPPRSPMASLLQTLLRAGHLARVAPARLSQTEILEVSQRLSPLYASPLAGWLARSSEGNPYVLAELVRFGRQQGVLQPDGQLNLSALPASPVVPQTVYNLIEIRLARLADPARRVLDAAVAMGREFDFEVVAYAAGLSEIAALDALDELRQGGLVFPLATGHGSSLGRFPHAFDHSLTMQVAYHEVGEARHRLLHRRVAEALESVHRGRLDSVAALIAFHYTEGNAPERAAPYAFRAGQWAAGLAAWAEAIEFYQQALAVDRDTARRRQILLALGEARFGAGEMAQASEAMRAALGLADPASSQADAASLALAQTLLAQARFSEVIALMQAVLAGGRPEFAVQAEMTWGTALSLEGADLEVAAEHLRRAEQLSAAQANPTHLAQTRFELGSLAAQQGDLPRAIGLYRESLAAAQTAAAAAASGDADHIRVVLAHNNLAYHLLLLSTTGREQARTPEVPLPGLAEASEHARAGLALAQEKGILPMQTYLLSTHGEIALASGDLEAARQYFEKGLSLAERLAMPERIAGLTANLGLLARRRGQTDLAIHHLSTALSQADALGTRHLAAQIRLWLAPLLPSAQARQYLAEARLIAESSGRRSLLEEAVRLESEFGRA